jgi:hypothetical protein
MIKEWLDLMTLITKHNNHYRYLLNFVFVASIITCSFVGGTNFLSNILCRNVFEFFHHNVVRLAWPLFISIFCTFMCNTFIYNIVFLYFLFIAMFSSTCSAFTLSIMVLWFLYIAMFSIYYNIMESWFLFVAMFSSASNVITFICSIV